MTPKEARLRKRGEVRKSLDWVFLAIEINRRQGAKELRLDTVRLDIDQVEYLRTNYYIVSETHKLISW